MAVTGDKLRVVDAIEPDAAEPQCHENEASARPGPSLDALKQAVGWAVGIPFASARYLAREVELRRHDSECAWPPDGFPSDVTRRPGGPGLVQPPAEGFGPAYRRLYEACIDDPLLTAPELMSIMQNDPSVACPLEIARFEKTKGYPGQMELDDEYRVRLPGPWNGPVRVVEISDCSFRLATLEGHMEAGEIEFRARQRDDQLQFEIESWARSGHRAFNLLYDRLGVSRELQLHMWAHFLERVAQISGGSMSDAIEVTTERCDEHPY